MFWPIVILFIFICFRGWYLSFCSCCSLFWVLAVGVSFRCGGRWGCVCGLIVPDDSFILTFPIGWSRSSSSHPPPLPHCRLSICWLVTPHDWVSSSLFRFSCHRCLCWVIIFSPWVHRWWWLARLFILWVHSSVTGAPSQDPWWFWFCRCSLDPVAALSVRTCLSVLNELDLVFPFLGGFLSLVSPTSLSHCGVLPPLPPVHESWVPWLHWVGKGGWINFECHPTSPKIRTIFPCCRIPSTGWAIYVRKVALLGI